MDWLISPEATLAGLFLASFLAATVLPGGSEAILVALLLAHPQHQAVALITATVGNTLGGMSTYALAYYLPQKLGAGEAAQSRMPAQSVEKIRRWGSPALCLAWLPVVGDALCAAAGYLRLPWLACALWMAVGKGARYGLIAYGLASL